MSGSQGVRCLLWLIMLAAVGAVPLVAQSLTHGSLAGEILREGVESELPGDTAALADVLVRATDASTGIAWSARTGRDGRFQLHFLPPGEYAVLVERLGYEPKRLEGVRIRPGARTALVTRLKAAPPPVERVDVVRWEGAPPAPRPGVVRGLTGAMLDALPEGRREVSHVGRLFSESTPTLETEGLPARYSALVVDGVPFASAWHPDVPSAALRGAAFPLSVMADVELATVGTDVELSGWSGSYLMGSTRRGTREFSTRLLGTWAGQALSWSSEFDPGATPHSALQGGVLVSGPIVTDTAAFVVGIEARRLEEVLPRAWVATNLDDELIRVAGNRGVNLERYAEPRLTHSEAVTASGRFDWQIGGSSALQVRGGLAMVPSADPDPVAAAAGRGAFVEGRDLTGAATLVTAFDERRAMEVRLSYESSLRDYGLEAGLAVPSTRLVLGGFAVGPDAGLPGRFERSAIRLTQALHQRSDRHHLKVGIAAVWNIYDHTYAYGRAGEFVFADPGALEALRGSFMQATGPLPAARFSVPRYGLFLQDQWRAAPGLELTAGVRYDLEQWPADRVQLNTAWLERTEISNANLSKVHHQLSPRFGLTWDVQEQGRWRVDVAAGLHYHSADPAILGEVLTHDGRVLVRRAVGDLGNWPEPPSSAGAPVIGPRLTLLGPKFEPPRTSRATVGVARHLGHQATLSLAATARRTQFLPRRIDLNRLPVVVAEDQYGRAIYGQLIKDGGLLVAEPGSNRRFSDFDLVSAITADGESDHLGFTVGIDRWEGQRLGVFGSYTYSRTTDDWPGGWGGGPEAQLRPFPDAPAASDWARGRSDYDIPHRLVLAGEVRLPSPLRPRVAAVYRYRSGYPFTPGFRAGVDASGDGSDHNDPAFVDEGVAGVTALLGTWDCLRLQTGRFAERNACREPDVHALDLRFALQVLRTDRYSAELVLDGLGVLESAVGLYDHALYLVDPDRDLVHDAAAGTVNVPLVANPGFGQLLARHSPSRVLRLGFRLVY